jgi:ATP-dependent DNA helicase RecG
MFEKEYNIPESRKLEFKETLPSGQSEIRNKTLGPIFKELQLIEQWGTGFQKLSNELKEYPEIELKINEPGLSFQIQFIKKDYVPPTTLDTLETDIGQVEHASTTQVPRKYHTSTTQVEVLTFCSVPRTRIEIHSQLGMKNRKYVQSQILKPLLEQDLLALTNPEKPNSPKQKYIISEKGKLLLEELK